MSDRVPLRGEFDPIALITAAPDVPHTSTETVRGGRRLNGKADPMSDRTEVQLLHVADRARRGVLLPDEVEQLADGIITATARAGFFEAALSPMRDRAEVADVRAQARVTELEQQTTLAHAAVTGQCRAAEARVAELEAALRACRCRQA
ncbi:hypothetical protein [Streptomyces laculatispora]|uniref:hypothetical protein n=1 Tax=Streptomyces laculatispora TaxID=887464 RepID=UPI001A94558F|nr:hypothetical protein [Streptomyces laculatispora]MBO0918829.1 hypothetical protein [Streptomyces laculatispora]